MLDAKKNKLRAPLFPLNARTLALTSMGLGFLRPAPGTWGSMPPVGLVIVLMLFDAGAVTVNIVLGVVLLVSCVLCVMYGEYAEERFGRKDAGEVVIDETAGQCVPLFVIPLSAYASMEPMTGFIRAALMCGSAFLLFRVFDIIKPWPARRLESLPAGWGVLADDLVAGLYAAAVMWLGLWLVL